MFIKPSTWLDIKIIRILIHGGQLHNQILYTHTHTKNPPCFQKNGDTDARNQKPADTHKRKSFGF